MDKTSNRLLVSSIVLLLLLITATWGWCATPVPYAPVKGLGNDVSTEVKTGSSVHYPSGTYNFTETDLSMYARGIPMSWGRTYRSNRVINKNGWMFDLPADGPLGYGWMNGWLVRIEGDAYVNGEGKYIYFTKDANGNYLTNQDAGLTLTKTVAGYELVEIGKYIYTFSAIGKLQDVRDLRGNSATLNYDTTGNLISITDSTGRIAFTLNYNSAGRIASVTNVAGRIVTYDYDVFGNLIKANLGGEILASYTYNSNHGLTTKANGLIETYTIDYYPVLADKGIVQKVLDPIGTQLRKEGKPTTGHETSFSYDFTNRVFFVTDYTGALFKHQVNSKGQLLSTDEIQGSDTIPVKRIEYQDNRIVKKIDSLGNSTLEQCDEWGNLIKRVDAIGEEKKQTFNTQNKLQTETDALGIITKYDYDTTGYLTKTTWGVGKPEETSTSYTYNSYGELLSTTTGNSTYTYEYNNLGRVTKITDSEGNIGTNEYDAIGNLIAYTDGVGNRSEYTYDAKDNPITWKDPLGNTATYSYNAARRLTSVKDALGRITQYETDFKGYTTAIIDPLNNRTEYSYDGNGNLIKATRGDSVITMTYDSANRVTSITDPEGNTTTYVNAKPGCASCSIDASPPDQVIDPLLNTTTYTFDKNRRITGITDPMSNVTAMVRNAIGSVASIKDANNNTTTYSYDALRRTTKQTDAAGGTVQFSYDNRGNLTSLTDPNGNTTAFNYDKNGRVTKETRPMGQSTENSYYPNGMLKTTKDANGNTTNLTYDKANRLTEITYADGTKDTFQYNAVGNLISYTSPGVSGTINYDELSRKTSETVNYGTFSKTYSYSYDAKGNRQSYTSPEGTTYNYGYNKNNQLKTITYNSQIISFDYQWNRLTKTTYPNGTTTTYDYNANSWLTDRNAKKGSTTIESGIYSFDKVGNITQQSSNTYGYDSIYQLINSSNTSNSETFSYDKSGNRTNSGYSHNANNELLSTDTATYTYDANGNTITKTENGNTTTYSYNARNKLAKITLPDGTEVNYDYDPFGRRIKKQTPTDTTNYLYANEGLIGEYTEAGTTKKTYGWRPNSIWGTSPLLQVDNNNYYYYHNDHLGTPRKLTDSTGAVLWQADYEAFGKAQVDPASIITNNLRFPGQYYDEETGLHYNLNRYYDPEAGRYEAKDPIGIIGGLNIFAYVKNNSISRLDPLGLLTIYGGFGGTAYLDGTGNASTLTGPIIYSDQTGFGSGTTFNSTGSSNDRSQTMGGGAGIGATIGFATGSLKDFSGSAFNTTIDVGPIAVTISSNGTNLGLSLSFGSKGFGAGMFMNESNTTFRNPTGDPCAGR